MTILLIKVESLWKLLKNSVKEETIQVVTISFFRFETIKARLWAFSQMLFARFHLNRIGGLTFYKLFGSGIGEGFTPIQNTRVYALLAVWEDHEKSLEGLDSPIFKRYENHSRESWKLSLKTKSVRGEWSNLSPFSTSKEHANDEDFPIVVLTRATIKPKILLKFFGHVPNISKVIGSDPNVMFKIGLAEVPFLHQVTFSIWPDLDSMIQFAHRDGPHKKAIDDVRKFNWFSEELYARFTIAESSGIWEGKSRKHYENKLKPLEVT